MDYYKIEEIKRTGRKNKFTIVFNNGEINQLSGDLILKYSLKKDKQIDNSLFQKLSDEQYFINLKQAAYCYASYKRRTRRQLFDKLKTKGYSNDDITKVIEFFKEYNLVNDELYAQDFVRDYIRKKPCGEAKLMFELTKRGISKELAADSVKKYFPADNKLEMAMTAARKKLRTLRHKENDKQKKSVVSSLIRQGFDWNTVKKVVQQVFSDESELT